MDHGFNDRVDKVFGSISSSSSTPWSLTDAPVERRSWNRDKGGGSSRDDDETLVSSSFDHLLNRQTNRLDWDIRSSIGLDPTLDNEEEEDAYDKMAQGRENGVYIKDVIVGPYLNVLPTSAPAPAPPEENENENGGKRIKSILKRKTDHEVAKGKRVRFHPTCKNDDVHVQVPQAQGSGLSVPDYILNPSNYTRYDLSHDDVNKESNSEAYTDSLKSKHDDDDVLPRSLVFIPRKKRGDVVCNSEKQSSSSTGIGIGIGIGIAISSSNSALEVGDGMQQQDEESHTVCTKPRPAHAHRRYRSKMDHSVS